MVPAIAATTFLLRFVVADRNSYWLDELFSVHQYGALPSTVSEALQSLAETSIHPPAYQFVLYWWIELFGSTETATRTLSNLYVTVAVVVLHRIVAKHHGAGIAHVTAAVFALSYAATYFGLESRSYAQTLSLCVGSAATLRYFLLSLAGRSGIGRFALSVPAVLFTAVNTLLLLTHYYNFFYWACQALFAVGFVLWNSRTTTTAARVPVVVSVYLVQLLIFMGLWGRNAYVSITSQAGAYAVESPESGPAAVVGALVEQTFSFGVLGAGTGAIAIIGLVASRLYLRTRSGRASHSDGAPDTLSTVYSLWMVVGPPTVAFLAFLLLGVERFSPRYFVFLVPHLALLGVLAGSQATAGALSMRWADRAQTRDRLTAVITIALVLLLVVPGTVRAARYEKTDFRGLANDVVAVIRSHADREFVIYQTSFRNIAMIDHYFDRHPDLALPPSQVIQRAEEHHGTFGFEKLAGSSYDHLIVVFAHHTVQEFPTAMDRLRARHNVHLARIDETGRGWVVFSADRSSEAALPSRGTAPASEELREVRGTSRWYGGDTGALRGHTRR